MSEKRPISRRRVLQTMGVGGAIAVAGCLHDNDDDCSDFTLDLSTGTTNGTVDSFGSSDSDWRVVSSPDGTTGHAVSIAPISQWATVPTANWIDPYGTGGAPPPNDPNGEYVYEIDFEVDESWSDDECELRIHQWAVDDEATIELEGPGGTTTLTQGTGFASLMGPVTEPVGPGQYTLRAIAQNNFVLGSITGLLIDADIYCECSDEPVDDSCALSITKSYVGEDVPVAPGDSIGFEITVCNDGDSACQQSPVTVVDQLPTGTTFVGDTGSGWDCTENAGEIVCEHPNTNGLAAGDCLPTLTLELEVDEDGYSDAIRNCATVEGATEADNDTDCASVPIAIDDGDCDLSISKTHEGDTVTPETPTQFELTVCNDGDARCDGPVTVVDSLPSGVSYDSGSGTGWTITANGSVVTCEHPNSNGLAAGDCLPPITLTVDIGPIEETGDRIVNCASLKYDDETVENNRDCITLPVQPVDDCNLAITKRHDGDVVTAGANTIFEITVCNNGDSDCTDPVTVEDTLPAGLTFVSHSGTGWSCTETGGTVTCTHPNTGGLSFGDCLPPLQLEVAVGSIDETGDQITNCARLAGSDQDSSDDRDCVTVGVVQSADNGCSGLNVEKSVGRQFRYGAQGTYQIEVCNYVEQTCNGAIEVTDTLAPGLTFVSHSGTGWSVSVAGGTVTATHANSGGLTAGQCLPVLTLVVAVDSASTFPGGSDAVTNCAQVSADGTLVDEDCITHVITNE